MNTGAGKDYHGHQLPPPYSPGPMATSPVPPPGFVVPPPPTATVTVIEVPTTSILGPEPCHLRCPCCHAIVNTRVDYQPSSRTHLMALLMCLIGLVPCCLIPYCMDSCQNANHYCPACGAYLGAYKR